MQPFSIPIMTLRLLDLQLPKKQYAEINFIGGAKDLIRNHHERAELAGIDLNLFHNNEVTYSGIQLDRHQGSPEWTGYGDEAVETLWFWLELFREQNPDLLKNSVMIQEHYSPDFLLTPKQYQLASLIPSKSVDYAIKGNQSNREIFQRLEKYLFGNMQTFFKYIGYQFDKEKNYLKIEIQDVRRSNKKFPVFREYKKTPYNIKFSCNFRLPQTLRLGQSTALGYGKVTHL